MIVALDMLARLPLTLLYGIGALLRLLVLDLVGYRRGVIAENIERSFPGLDARERNRLARRFRARFAEVIMEIVKARRIDAGSLRRRVTFENLEIVSRELGNGTPVLISAAHHGNWEWLLLGLCLNLGYPVDAAYKPLHDTPAERFMAAARSRFGARLVPAKSLLTDVLKQGRRPRVIALVADQEPVTADRRHWTSFLGRDTAFYMGLGELARATRYPVYFAAMSRSRRGCYVVRFHLLAGGGENLSATELTERYARAVENQVLGSPECRLWSNRRWKLTKPLYS